MMIYVQTSANTRLQHKSDTFIKYSRLNRSCIKINLLFPVGDISEISGGKTYHDLKKKNLNRIIPASITCYSSTKPLVSTWKI